MGVLDIFGRWRAIRHQENIVATLAIGGRNVSLIEMLDPREQQVRSMGPEQFAQLARKHSICSPISPH